MLYCCAGGWSTNGRVVSPTSTRSARTGCTGTRRRARRYSRYSRYGRMRFGSSCYATPRHAQTGCPIGKAGCLVRRCCLGSPVQSLTLLPEPYGAVGRYSAVMRSIMALVLARPAGPDLHLDVMVLGQVEHARRRRRRRCAMELRVAAVRPSHRRASHRMAYHRVPKYRRSRRVPDYRSVPPRPTAPSDLATAAPTSSGTQATAERAGQQARRGPSMEQAGAWLSDGTALRRGGFGLAWLVGGARSVDPRRLVVLPLRSHEARVAAHATPCRTAIAKRSPTGRPHCGQSTTAAAALTCGGAGT